ncbi:Rbd2p [Sugiyamaella lignohabitans]|uniref:Rbd2p n=1 Tax=Sugiyamaella lignohabitans TaxID=796027 RepID=A0A167EFZ2_9ASCO|nr:Rbd2p [Sugiyamaella lignohabitans]ANB14033.1 Rbd2p [Sugiyamaella lignohabitans]
MIQVLAVVPGVVYCILGLLFFPNAAVAGASGWVFSFLGYFAYQDYRRTPLFNLSATHAIPTWSTPLVPLVMLAIFLPGSSFLGHLLGLLAGWAMALGYLDPLIEPSTKVVEWIEVKLARAIALIPSQFHFIGEVSARESRALARSDPLPTTETPVAATAGAGTQSFSGPGHVLGQ